MRSNFYKGILICTIVLMILNSCNRKAQLIYMNNLGNENVSIKPISPYLLKSGDILYVQIQTQDQKTSSYFNKQVSTSTNQMQGSMLLFGYSVSDSGYIQLPLLGMLKVSGLTIGQTQELVQKEADKFLNDGLVIVKLLNFNITILGEVRGPGIKTSSKENLTIFEGLALAGDFSDYADRSSVMIVRQTPTGIKSDRINLHDKNIILSEYYYLLPNDVLFVEPRKVKILNMNAGNISFFISLFNTALLLYTYFTKF